MVWDALDLDHSGYIEFAEFNRKLEMYGVRTRSTEELILTQILEAAQKGMKSLSDLFQAFDLSNRGYIDRQDMKDVFQ